MSVPSCSVAIRSKLNPVVLVVLQAPVQYEALLHMEYLDSVINESLRLYPVVLRLERVAKASVKINDLTIPKDTVVMVPVWALHRDPAVWADPEEFKPERCVFLSVCLLYLL